jgi:septal ring factor EnvC (AmiA/AmiB activator)
MSDKTENELEGPKENIQPPEASDRAISATSQELLEKYSELGREELLNLLISTESSNLSISADNFALVEQVKQSQKDIAGIQSDLVRMQDGHRQQIAELKSEVEKYKNSASERDSQIVFLEDHARFSADQTKLSIAHWELILKNRDENIELLSHRLTQLTNDQTDNEGSSDKYKCLLERFRSLHSKYIALCPTAPNPDDGDAKYFVMDKVYCPWRNQADVRVAQLERVTGQLNSTYEQLHAKSDELLLLNRTVGSLRKKVSELEQKLKKYKSRWWRAKNEPPIVATPGESSEEQIGN